MKNFFKRPTKTNKSNILIDYTKWLFKMIFIGAVLISVLLYLFIKYEKSSEKSRNILFTLNCEAISVFEAHKEEYGDIIGNEYKSQGVGFESGKLWYIEELLEGNFNNESYSFKPSYIDIGEPEWFEPEDGLYKGDYYFSGILGGRTWYIINRVNLTATLYNVDKEDKYKNPLTFKALINFQCSQISEKEYKKASDELKKSIQNERKI